MTNESIKLLKLLRCLSVEKQQEFLLMIKGAAIVADKSA